MDVALVVIGNEVLSGETLDTNGKLIGTLLADAGFVVKTKITIPDIAGEIKNTLTQLLANYDIILMTGGLGPTNDDVTRNVLADYFNSELVFDPVLFDHIKELLKHRHPNLTIMNEQQAIIPKCASVLKNNFGTAPGLLVRTEGKILIAMPGVPYEVKGLMEEQVIPLLIKEFSRFKVINRNIRLVGLPESMIAGKIKEIEDSLPVHIKLAYLPHMGQVKLRLTAMGIDEKRILPELDALVSNISALLADYVYGYDDEELPATIGRMLKEGNSSLSIAESCTGGYISHLITSIPGSSEYFKGSIISYANEVKSKLLSIDKSILSTYGAVSEETAQAMSEGVRKLMNTDYSLAATGIAGPDGGTEFKPVGTLWLAASSSEKTITKRIVFYRGRLQNIQFFSTFGLDLLRRLIKGLE
jgi:nicotinamide-nucleotide amidase